MKGVMLVNMGGATSEVELKHFLFRMFKDPFILPYGKLFRTVLGFIISRSRFRKSWKKYELIGGSPLIASAHKNAEKLQEQLGDSFCVESAFSYSEPGITVCLNSFKYKGITEITVIPMYPQASFTTTSSVVADVTKIVGAKSGFKIKWVNEFYSHPGFIAFWNENISTHIRENKIQNPILMFSAHSIPEYLVQQGDTYPLSIEKSAGLIAKELGLTQEVAFQSGMRHGKWIGPDVKDRLKEHADRSGNHIVLIPISFVHENLETRFDLDHDIIPFAKNTLGISNISRVNLPDTSPIFINLLADLVLTT